MTIAAAEKPAIKTGNVILDMELPLLTADELGKLADYAKSLRLSREDDAEFAQFLRWSRDDENHDWADAPLTEDEISQIEESDRDYENGIYLTLDELLEGLQKCGQ